MSGLSRSPHPALSPFVRRFYGFEERTGAALRRREGPGASVVVVISFGNEWRIGDPLDPAAPFARHTSFVAGLHDRAVITEHDGWSAGMQVDLEPPAASRLLGAPMGELARRTVSLDALFGRAGDRLAERLAETPSWAARFDVLERALATRLGSARPGEPGVAWAWRRLRETGGSVRVSSLAAELGWSRRRLAARFREELGLPPKALARLLRVERALGLLEQQPPPPWAEIAVTCGYFDQSHLINDVRALTGVTPTTLAAERAP